MYACYIPTMFTKHQCYACGTTEKLQKTYLIPLETGGDKSKDNTIYLCKGCYTFLERRKIMDSDSFDPFVDDLKKTGAVDKYAKLLQLDTIRLGIFMKDVYKRIGEIDKENQVD